MNVAIQPNPHSARVSAATNAVGSTHHTCIVAPLGTGSIMPQPGRMEGSTFDTNAHPLLLAVVDGAGDSIAGNVASALVLESLRRHLPARSVDWDRSLHDAIDQANRDVWDVGKRSSRPVNAATLTAVCVHGHDAHIADVGNSRAYLLRNRELQLLTAEQSYARLLLDAELLTPDEAVRFSKRHIILETLGQAEHINVDVGHVRLLGGDTLFLCSDGLASQIGEDEIRDELIENASPSKACSALVRLARDCGGAGNITAIVAKIS